MYKIKDHAFKNLVFDLYFGLRWVDIEKDIYLNEKCLDTHIARAVSK